MLYRKISVENFRNLATDIIASVPDGHSYKSILPSTLTEKYFDKVELRSLSEILKLKEEDSNNLNCSIVLRIIFASLF